MISTLWSEYVKSWVQILKREAGNWTQIGQTCGYCLSIIDVLWLLMCLSAVPSRIDHLVSSIIQLLPQSSVLARGITIHIYMSGLIPPVRFTWDENAFLTAPSRETEVVTSRESRLLPRVVAACRQLVALLYLPSGAHHLGKCNHHCGGDYWGRPVLCQIHQINQRL